MSRDDLEAGTVLVKPESADTFTVEETKTLKGVYNINRGYAEFKKVTILCESDEYYIVVEMILSRLITLKTAPVTRSSKLSVTYAENSPV